MSCINLSFPPARKAWKSFTSKWQTKLRRLNKSKAIKKHKYHFNTTIYTTKAIKPLENLFEHTSDKKRRKCFFNRKKTLPFKNRGNKIISFHFQKKVVPPVYIDKLFLEPVKGPVAATSRTTTNSMNSKVLGCQAGKMVAETNKKDGERSCQADDMWESLDFASPQMHGIDERAEKFISSFRAEMELEEIMARRL